MQRNDWHGVYSAITTKLDRDENVDLAAVADDVTFQLDARVHGIVCCGSLGEASTLTADEKLSIVATAKDASNGRAPVVLTIAEDFDPRRGAACRGSGGDRRRRPHGAAGDALRIDAARDDRPLPHRGGRERPRHHGLQQPDRLCRRRDAGDAGRDGGRAEIRGGQGILRRPAAADRHPQSARRALPAFHRRRRPRAWRA